MSIEKNRLNTKKKVIENQKYEDYWKCTLALTNFHGEQFIRTLTLIIEHIEKYDLANKTPNILIKNLDANRKQFNAEVVHNNELETKIKEVFPNDDESGATTRKQINTFIKLGFIKPYLRGFVPAAKEYVKYNVSSDVRSRLFSDTVYEYSSFNSSMTNDDTSSNQIKFLVNTLLNKEEKRIEFDEFMGIMQMDVRNREFARDKEILNNKNWANHICFFERKYNQISHLKSILSYMSLFLVTNSEVKNEFIFCLEKDAEKFIPCIGDTTRDSYRYGLMRKAVFMESELVYGSRISWYSKEPSEALVVSHIYASADALRGWDIDEAYDPNNALLLKPGDEDQYLDKCKMTFGNNGEPVFSTEIRDDFILKSKQNGYKLDPAILSKERLYYLNKYHQTTFREKFSSK